MGETGSVIFAKAIFNSGVIIELNQSETERFQKKRGTCGRQFPVFRCDNGTEFRIDKVEILEMVPQEEKLTDPLLIIKEEKEVPESSEEPKPEDEMNIHEKRQKEEDDFMAKVNCKHKEVSLYFQQTKKGKRYFPVCDFCGHRGRYIGTTKLSEEEKADALEYMEK